MIDFYWLNVNNEFKVVAAGLRKLSVPNQLKCLSHLPCIAVSGDLLLAGGKRKLFDSGLA